MYKVAKRWKASWEESLVPCNGPIVQPVRNTPATVCLYIQVSKIPETKVHYGLRI